MACFQCKMCGATLQITEGEKIIACDYCGTSQTLPKLTNDGVVALYDRAGHFRRNNDFDKAARIYEQILEQDSTDAEAYWSLVLCSYGVEYVEDPRTHRRMITVNRIQYTSVFDDENYKAALQYADVAQREIYQAEAQDINNIQKIIWLFPRKKILLMFLFVIRSLTIRESVPLTACLPRNCITN